MSLVSGLLVPAAQASTTHPVNPGKTLSLAQQAIVSASQQPSGTPRQRSTAPAGNAIRTGPHVVTGPGTGTLNGFHSTTLYPEGTAGTEELGFATTYTFSWPWYDACGTVTANGSSYAYWLGSVPFDANAISLTDHIWVSGIAISVSIPAISVSIPPGIAMSADGTGVVYTSTVYNNWTNTRQYSNVGFHSCVSMSTPYQVDSDALAFGSASYYDNT
ncbi:MAG: hypothetical protein ACYCU5_13840 [Actinomycetes bacterium]